MYFGGEKGRVVKKKKGNSFKVWTYIYEEQNDNNTRAHEHLIYSGVKNRREEELCDDMMRRAGLRKYY